MLPVLSANNATDLVLMDAEMVSQRLLRFCASSVLGTNGSDDFCCDLRLGVGFSGRASLVETVRIVRRNIAALLASVGVVVSACAKKQVAWIDAGGIVAAVTDTQAVRYFSVGENPREPVRSPYFYASVEPAVSVRADARSWIDEGGPVPAFVWADAIHFCPKSLYDGGGKHSLILSRAVEG